MLEKILTKIIQKANPGRDVSVERVGKHFLLRTHDMVGCNGYLLDGHYSYDEVVALNNLIVDNKEKFYCGFGFCKELGPVAFIGVYNPKHCTKSGYFQYNVHEYGTSPDDSEYYWKVYAKEVAKKIKNYTVYGFWGIEAVATKAPIKKMQYIHDSRYISKRNNDEKLIIEMDLKLSGKYTFNEARLLATGTIKDKEWFSGEEHPIQFVVVGDNQYIGIINLWKHENNIYFRDVWEYGADKPEIQRMRFLSKEEAMKVDEFSLYVYIYPYSLKSKSYPIEKQDRTFDSRFEFHLADGTDYRLI